MPSLVLRGALSWSCVPLLCALSPLLSAVNPRMGKGGKIAPDDGAEPIGTGNEEVATDAGAGSTGVGKVVVPPSEGTVGTGEFPGATDDEVDPIAGAGPTGEVGNVAFSPGKSTAGTESGESTGVMDDEANPVPAETKASGKAEKKTSPRETEGAGEPSIGTPTGIEKQQTVSVCKIKARTIAERMYDCKCSELLDIQKHVDDVIEEEMDFFAPVVTICPKVNVMFAHVLLNQVRKSVKNIDGTLPIHGWGEKECKNVGRSFALFVRKRKSGDVALDAWRRHFVHLKKLFDEVDGFEELMLVFANNLLRDR